MTSDPACASAVPHDDEGLICPLCDYSLRGLEQPRCPECGYAFKWEELRDPARRRHPYLFEHHPERNFWSLRRTFFNSLRPRRFWAGLYPTQKSNLPRRIIYWLIVAFLFLLPFVGRFGYAVFQIDGQNHLNRTRMLAWMSADRQQMIIDRYGSMQNWLDLTYPVLPSPRVFMYAAQSYWIQPIWFITFCILAWPWLTMAALMVFQTSMRKAKVKPVHVLRCVIYSADGMICGSLAMLGWLLWNTSPVTWIRWGYSGQFQFVKNMPLLLFVVLTYRLWIAYRTYLVHLPTPGNA